MPIAKSTAIKKFACMSRRGLNTPRGRFIMSTLTEGGYYGRGNDSGEARQRSQNVDWRCGGVAEGDGKPSRREGHSRATENRAKPDRRQKGIGRRGKSPARKIEGIRRYRRRLHSGKPLERGGSRRRDRFDTR